MNERLIEIEKVFQKIAAVNPPADASAKATARALARVRAAIPATHTPSRQWLWPVSIAAALMVAASLAVPFMLLRRVSAQQALAATVRETAAYKGWVHMTLKGKARAAWNTANGDFLEQADDYAVKLIKPRAGEIQKYLVSTHTLYIGSLDPDYAGRLKDSALTVPLNFADLLASLQANLGGENVTVTQTTDRGMDRFDIAFPKAKLSAGKAVWSNAAWMNPVPPSTIWVDPKTKLMREMEETIHESREYTLHYSLTYGAPEYDTVFDAGVPRDAKVVDHRLNPETRAAYERIKARGKLDVPDGVLLTLWQRGNDLQKSELNVDFRSGTNWAERNYPVAIGSPAPGKVQWAEDLKEAGSILIRMANVFPQRDQGGDGKIIRRRNYDPITGDVWHIKATWAGDRNIIDHVPGEEILNVTDLDRVDPGILIGRAWLGNYAYPLAMDESLFEPVSQLELITSPGRPGLTAFRTTNVQSHFIQEEWFDPAHGDRMVEYVITGYKDDLLTTPHARLVTQFADHSPLPDGRTYPATKRTLYYEPNAQGQWVSTKSPESVNIGYSEILGPVVGKLSLRFFPGAKLPDIPAKPPAPSTPALP